MQQPGSESFRSQSVLYNRDRNSVPRFVICKMGMKTAVVFRGATLPHLMGLVEEVRVLSGKTPESPSESDALQLSVSKIQSKHISP